MASSEAQLLKQRLAITPKTASMLVSCGYKEYRDLRTVSPNHVVEQFKGLLGIAKTQAESYRRGIRRMVWLGSQDEPEEQAKIYQQWTQKALKAMGIWSDDFDSLTGDEINQRMEEVNQE